jgi:adenosylcobyric acid synthase
MLSRIANFDDFDSLRHEPGVRLVMVPPGTPLPAEAALVILPGTKATTADLAFFRAQGWDIDLAAHLRRGGHVLGVCGGYQMLGRSIADPDGVEGSAGTVAGLGYLPIATNLTGDKRVTRTEGVELLSQAPFEGYEIHVGRTTVDSNLRPLLRFADGTVDGVISADGRVAGCYVHGLFDRAEQRAVWLKRIGATSDGVNQSARVDAALDEIADVLARVVDVEKLAAIAASVR